MFAKMISESSAALVHVRGKWITKYVHACSCEGYTVEYEISSLNLCSIMLVCTFIESSLSHMSNLSICHRVFNRSSDEDASKCVYR